MLRNSLGKRTKKRAKIQDDYRVLVDEIREYNPHILEKPKLVVLNKIDDDESEKHLKEFYQKFDGECLEISAVIGEGVPELMNAIIETGFAS